MAKRSPRNATTGRGGKRFYSWRNEKYWSVTTILNVVPKPALLPWGMKAVATSAVNNIDVLAPMAERDPDGAIDWLKRAPYRDRDKAADLGSRVHEAAESYRLGKPMPPWDDDVAPRMRGFVRWLEDFKPSFHAVEASVYNRSQHYAGTLDAIVDLEGEPDEVRQLALSLGIEDLPEDRTSVRLVMDYKTARTGIYPEVGLQLSAYRNAEFIGLPDGTEEAMPPVDGAAALWLKPDGYEFVGVRADDEVWQSFLYTREMFRWQERVSKEIVGAPVPARSALEGATS